MTARRLAGFAIGTLTAATALVAGGLIWMAATDPLAVASLTTAPDVRTLAAAIIQRLIIFAF